MIRINLASRKQASFVAGGGGARGGTSGGTFGGKTGFTRFGGLGKVQLDLEAIRSAPVRKIAISIIASVIAFYVQSGLKEEKLKAVESKTQELQAEKQKLQMELTKMAGYEPLKKQLDEDEFILTNKIETIQKLIQDRDSSSKLLILLSETIPKNVWLQSFKTTKAEIAFKGKSADYDQVTEFMNRLRESALFAELNLKSTESIKDQSSGVEMAQFELEGKRR